MKVNEMIVMFFVGKLFEKRFPERTIDSVLEIASKKEKSAIYFTDSHSILIFSLIYIGE